MWRIKELLMMVTFCFLKKLFSSSERAGDGKKWFADIEMRRRLKWPQRQQKHNPRRRLTKCFAKENNKNSSRNNLSALFPLQLHQDQIRQHKHTISLPQGSLSLTYKPNISISVSFSLYLSLSLCLSLSLTIHISLFLTSQPPRFYNLGLTSRNLPLGLIKSTHTQTK